MAVGGEPPIVLVVDDEAALRFLCRVNLELEGYRVVEAGTLDDARAALDADEIAVVLLDLHIGTERGDTLLREIQARVPSIPVVIVTGSVEIEAGERGLGAHAVLGKPFTIDELRHTVNTLAGRDVPS